jgi:hypothetical protein
MRTSTALRKSRWLAMNASVSATSARKPNSSYQVAIALTAILSAVPSSSAAADRRRAPAAVTRRSPAPKSNRVWATL